MHHGNRRHEPRELWIISVEVILALLMIAAT
jgi:hypothetical protein